MRFFASALLLVALAFPGQAAAPWRDSPPSVRDILQRHCASCHGEGVRPKGGLGHITDLERLVLQGQVIPRQPEASPLYDRVARNEMPPKGKPPLSVRERDLLRAWIVAGAPTGASSGRAVREADLARLIKADLEAQPERQRRFFRYLTLAAFAGRPESERATLRQAVAKLVNSLSWHAELSVPDPLPGGLVYRLDLRHYRWSARTWDRLAATYPYKGNLPVSEVARLSGADLPVLRADWFLANASRTPFYHDFLALPNSEKALERRLEVDPAVSFEEETAVRSGFNGSGVARANRLIERHDAAYGAYWRSYDFSDNTARQNLFEFPLGGVPNGGEARFRHAGGEIIFHLPNGLQGYMLSDGEGRRIDRAPAEIVSDPNRPDRIVENGVSCIGCHAQGIIPKEDQVRAQVLKNKNAFGADLRQLILSLYAPQDRMKKLVQNDNDRFAAALKRLGVTPSEVEPVLAMVKRYEDVLDRQRAADELGLPADELVTLLRKSADLGRSLGPLLSNGTVQRQVFEEAFPRLLRELPAGTVEPPVVSGTFALGTGVRALAFAPDGRSFAVADSDGSVRVRNMVTGQLALLGKHSDEAQAVDISADSRQVLSAGADRVVLLWDITTPTAKPRRLVGHTAGVRTTLFLPNGKQAVSGGDDRTIRHWDLSKATVIRALTGHAAAVTSLAVSQDGKRLLSGSRDRTARLWDVVRGEEVAKYSHSGEVYAVALSADGKMVAVGGGDRSVAVWESGKLRRQFSDLPGTVVGIRFRERELLVACLSKGGEPLFRFDLDSGKSWPVGPRCEVAPPEALALASDGRALLAMAGEARLLRLKQPR